MSETLTGTATDIPEYPMDRDAMCPFAPPPQMLEMGAAKPLSRVKIWDGSTPWLITGHEVARELFADPRVSVDDRLDGFPHWNEHMLSTVNKRPRSVFTSDAEEHTRFRRMLSKPFTFKRVEGLRSAIQEVTDECIDAILAGPQPADIVTKLALPVPTKVISEMLGVPYEDHEFFQHHANVGLARYASAEDGQKGAMSLHKYLINLVETKMANPTEDAVSDLAERVNAGEYDYLIMSQYTEDSRLGENGKYWFPIYAWVKNDPALEKKIEETDIQPESDWVFKVNGELSPKYCPSAQGEKEIIHEANLEELEPEREEPEGGTENEGEPALEEGEGEVE